MSISKMFVSKKNALHIRQLYPGSESDKMMRNLGKEKARIFVLIMIVTAAVFVPVFIFDNMRQKEPVRQLLRNGYGRGKRAVTLKVLTGDGYENKIAINVNERKYTDGELSGFSEELDGILWNAILGENDAPDNVMYDLDLKTRIEGYPFDITWKSDKPLLVSSKGVIDTKRLSKFDPEDEGVNVRLCATLKYGDHSEDKYAYVCLHKRRMTAQEAIAESIAASVEEEDDRTKTSEVQMLPEDVSGTEIWFFDAAINRGWAVLFFGVVSAALAMSVKDRKLKEMCDRRQDQMDRDHPGILNQYILYYMAGMNPRSIWMSICNRYEDDPRRTGKNRRYAYEEMLTAKKRMEEGCSELAAYDEFATRCDNVRYRSFISFVKQAVVKGNEGLYDILYEEMEKAQREKNNRIKMEASEAQTKLLLPMFMMLAVVLAVVMIPAFIGLNS